ncbi:MAG: UbiD family decarboxylase [Chloroflexi bacterium]|nr:UbiD family decarboxylase [Chloroflexota bacterium]
MPKDLHTFISQVAEILPDRQLVVKGEIDSKFEIVAFLRHLEDEGKYPAVLFENVKSIDGEPGKRVYINVTADRRRVCVALDLDPSKWKADLTREFGRRAGKLVEPVTISRGEAPVKEVIQTGSQIDQSRLPIIYHHEMDGNPYGTGLVLSKKTGNLGYNLSYHRTMYKSPQSTGILMAPYHTWKIFRENEKNDRPTPVVMLHGHHPAVFLAGVYQSPWPWDEYGLAGAFLGEPLRLVPSETWGEDFLVPADAEVLVEGEILPNVREPEGPFGEFTGYYGPQRQGPVIRVTAVTRRRDYVYYGTNIGHLDHPGIGFEAEIYRRVDEVLPGSVKGVCAPYSGRTQFHYYISIEKLAEGTPAIAASAAMTIGFPKLIVIVDDDVDPYNEQEVLTAVATRFQADRDLTVIPKVRGSLLDPKMDNPWTHACMFIDATKPVGEPFPERVKSPKPVLERVKLEDYVSRELLNRIPVGDR